MTNFAFSIIDYMKAHFVDVLLIMLVLFVLLIFIVKLDIHIIDDDNSDTANTDYNIIEGLSLQHIEKSITNGTHNDEDDEQHELSKEYDEERRFCEAHKGDSNVLEEKCGMLHNDTCKTSSCCVLTHYTDGSKKCVAGSKTGPTFLSDEKQNMIEMDNYYYMNKCYGKGCE